MTREDILNNLKELKPEITTCYNVNNLALFGSFVRDEASPDSDIDVLVDFNDNATLFDLSRLGQFLENHLKCKVDIVSRRALRKEFRTTVLRESIPI